MHAQRFASATIFWIILHGAPTELLRPAPCSAGACSRLKSQKATLPQHSIAVLLLLSPDSSKRTSKIGGSCCTSAQKLTRVSSALERVFEAPKNNLYLGTEKPRERKEMRWSSTMGQRRYYGICWARIGETPELGRGARPRPNICPSTPLRAEKTWGRVA